MVKKKHVAKTNTNMLTDNMSFNIDDVIHLGGDKADYEMLLDINDEDDPEDLDADPVNHDELAEFINDLGLDQVTYSQDGSSDDDAVELAGDPGDPGDPAADSCVANGLTVTSDGGQRSGKKTKNKFKLEGSGGEGVGRHLIADFIADYKPRSHLLVKPGIQFSDHQFKDDPTDFKPATPELVSRLKLFAEKLLADDVALYHDRELRGKRSGEVSWRQTVLASGTLADKMAALTLMVQDSPLHSLASLDSLVAMAGKKGKREALLAVDTLRELFLSTLLPANRKLRSFEQHALCEVARLASGNRDSHDKRLLLWWYEAELKTRYAEYIQAIDTISHDTVAATKQKALATFYELLCEKPEQEKTLLAMLVNKLGDPDYKVAAKVVHLLNTLVERHPNMNSVIVIEVESLLYRPNIAIKAQYYAVCFLNQLILDHNHAAVAAQLINIYFSFFKVFVEKGDVDSKMLSALLTGVNRAYPFAEEEKEKIEEQVNLLYLTVHTANFNTSVQTLMLLYQVMHAGDLSDRYYAALYRKLGEAALRECAHPASMLSLLYRSMRADACRRRVRAFAKRLLQVCAQHSAPAFSCAGLILLSQVMKNCPDLLNTVTTKEDSDGDDEEERFVDVKEETDEERTGSEEGVEDGERKGRLTTATWVHKRNTRDDKGWGHYDPLHRNPLYCHADRECMWELRRLASHHHPSVALFAQTLLKGQNISYPGDPLQDFTLIRFLDRFVYRNPKKQETTGSVRACLGVQRRAFAPRDVRAIAVNSADYLKVAPQSVPVNETFLYRYFQNKATKGKNTIDDADSDADSIGDAEFEEFLDEYESQFDTAADVDLDFAQELGKHRQKSKAKRGRMEEDDSEESDDASHDGDDLSDEEMEFGDDEEFKNVFASADDDVAEDGEAASFEDESGGFDEEAAAFSDSSDDMCEAVREAGQRNAKKVNMSSTAKKADRKNKRKETSTLFAAAEEFSHLIDENTDTTLDTIGSEAMAVSDNAHVKQLQWEDAQEKWMQGKDWKSMRRSGKLGKLGRRNDRALNTKQTTSFKAKKTTSFKKKNHLRKR